MKKLLLTTALLASGFAFAIMDGMKMPTMPDMDMDSMKMPGMDGMKMPTMPGMDSMTEEGKELHNESSCMRCHGSEMYTRDDRKVLDYSDLKRQVSFCSNNLSTGWFPEEEQLVVDFLNKTYYQYKE